MKLILFVTALLLSASASAQEACTASPPIIPADGSHYCAGATCASTPEAVGRTVLSSITSVPGLTNGVRGCQAQLNLCPCIPNASGGYFCGYTVSANICTGAIGSCSTPPFWVTVERKSACRPGYVPLDATRCQSRASLLEDLYAQAQGKALQRDEHGNILQVFHAGKTVANFGDYDEHGRPGWYDDGMDRVNITWPAAGACLFSALEANGWTSRFTWLDEDRPGSITTPLDSYTGTYSARYFEDGNLEELKLTLPFQYADLVKTWEYGDAGELLSTNTVTHVRGVPTPPRRTTLAASPLEPRLQPKVNVFRPAPGAPGGAALELLGPMSLLYPAFDYLGRQIAQFYMNVAASADDDALNAKCAKQYFDDRAACDKFWTDRGFDPDRLPTNDMGNIHHECKVSATLRQKQCMRGEVLSSLSIPFQPFSTFGCEHQLADELELCRNATYALFPGAVAGPNSPYPGKRQLDLYDCVLSAQARYAQCKDSVPLAQRTPLKLPTP